MVHHFSRRSFIKATSSLLVGAAAAGNVSLINPLRAVHAQISPAKWMANVADNTRLSRLSIPGTHESCCLHGGPITVCQNRSLQQQLDAGIRFLDIRCRHIQDVFTIHHGSVYQKINFGGGVRDVCINFLKANPSECIVMSIKEEYKATDNKGTFEDTFKSYVVGLERFWYFGASIPLMGEVRGKIVLVQRFLGNPMGIALQSWPDNATFAAQASGVPIEIQDQYKVPSIFSINNKWEAIQKLLDRAKGDTSNAWYINFSSGSSLFAYPSNVADQINPRLASYVNSSVFNKVGTLAMDFPSDDLINRIISVNSRPVPIFQ